MSATPRPTETAPVRMRDLLDMASRPLKQEVHNLEIEEQIAGVERMAGQAAGTPAAGLMKSA